jgi:nucleoside phosphorylase
VALNPAKQGGAEVIAIFAAMESEVLACPEWTRNGERRLVGGPLVIEGDGAIVCQTGIGREPAERASDAVLSTTAPSAVLSVGLAGGLVPGVGVGEIVACTHVDHESHRHSGEELSVYADQRLLDAAIAIGTARVGTSLTVDEAAWGPAEKAAHHAWKSHDIVEMETFWIAAAASRRGLPFLAVRSISDSSADTLPNLGIMRPDGTMDREKFLQLLRERPDLGDQLSAVAQNSRLALENLARFLDVYLPSLVKAGAR